MLGRPGPVGRVSVAEPRHEIGVEEQKLIVPCHDDLLLGEVHGPGPAHHAGVRIERGDSVLVWRTIPPAPATAYRMQVATVPGTVLTAAATEDEVPRYLVFATDENTGRIRP